VRPITLVLALAGLCCAGNSSNGIRPRGSSSDYRNQETGNGTSVAEEIVPADQVRSMFSTDLIRDYVVVEVAVYPAPDGSYNVSAGDFMLHCGTQIIRPGNPNAIATRKQQQNAPRRSDVDIYPSVGVGYESGRDPYGRSRAVYTTTGVAVATGGATNPRPASTDQDRRTMALELEEKQLPEGPATKPVAGYLYFPFPSSKQKNVAYELEYDGPAGRMRLYLK
jgi:hypothetical protein